MRSDAREMAWTTGFSNMLCAWRLAVTLVLALLAAHARSAAGAETPRPKPNIVLIVADDLGWKDVGYHGSEIKTPSIDKLAASGVQLDQFYVSPLCSPTRACLMTGRYPMRQGLQVLVIFPWAQYGLPLEERTLPQALKEAGYETAMTGKWHLGHCDKAYLPLARGFDHHYGLYNGAIDYYTHKIGGGLDWHRDGKAVVEEGYSTELIGNEAVRTIERHDFAKPLFLYVPFNAPHAPLEVPESYARPYQGLERPKRRNFAGMVACEDAQIGRITAALAARKVDANTLVIFFSDNGGLLGEGADNGDLRGGKGTLYEGGTRVPCLAVWPGTLKPGVVKEPLHVADWYPTLLKLAGAGLEQRLKLDGQDAWPAIAGGKPSPHEEILLNVTPKSGALRAGDWKLVENGGAVSEDLEKLGTSSQRAKAREAKKEKRPERDGGESRAELFNLADDPGEKTNLAEKHPDKLADLKARLARFAREAVEPKAAPEPEDFKAPRVWGGEE